MPIICFCSARGDNTPLDSTTPLPSRPAHLTRPKKASFRRQGTGTASSRTSSNSSISQLPPCVRLSDAKLEAMMMPVPPETRPSRCLRLSHPKIYSSIVSDMKQAKGCRDWRNFAVFEVDELDSNISAVEFARKRALDYERKLARLASFTSNGDSYEKAIDD